MYGRIDERFLRLGMIVCLAAFKFAHFQADSMWVCLQLKKWAKVCGINDASNATLSSYAIITLLLHFLQRTLPPVLPFLQQVCF
jgi:hypothetical protein